MNSPLVAFDKFESATLAPERKRADVVPINQDIGRLIETLSISSAAGALENFRHSVDHRDSKAIDYLLLVVLSLLVHSAVVDHFKHASVEKEQLAEPVKPPSKVQITFARPQPPKPAVVQPPPPPKVVAINKPPKPKVQPKPAPKVEPPPIVTPTPTAVQADAPVVSAPPAPPKVEEKVTEPHAGAGYLDNPPPVYPDVAMERGWEGKVLMKVHVLANGKPDSVSVVKSSGQDVLDAEAVRTVKQWSFVPAMRGTTPIDGWVTVPISFNLQS
ncbi:energy transducer TonB [Candidatus Methylobacter oryzae]|uniref:Protein TonB n=1 Tax=Candidatus Methylobacter oryzae TaxID=2497749 RepID=A0ABY3CEP4_9GAMM|nr:energy transducer TonB [Candidatus Methylobacter oryzae]TRX01622.1 energy transducer TonB [Candidatus Methylobacter oryzae]